MFLRGVPEEGWRRQVVGDGVEMDGISVILVNLMPALAKSVDFS